MGILKRIAIFGSLIIAVLTLVWLLAKQVDRNQDLSTTIESKETREKVQDEINRTTDSDIRDRLREWVQPD